MGITSVLAPCSLLVRMLGQRAPGYQLSHGPSIGQGLGRREGGTSLMGISIKSADPLVAVRRGWQSQPGHHLPRGQPRSHPSAPLQEARSRSELRVRERAA